MKNRKLFIFLFSFLLIFSFLYTSKQAVIAQDFYGLNDLNLALESEVEPKSAIVNIINLALGFLGLIAVIIIIYGGFVWMMSGGQAEKIDNAKKILKNGLIGLVIILLSWGIATFVFSFFAGGGGGGGASGCTPGNIRNCGCENLGQQICLADGTWGECSEDPCPVIPIPDINCSSNQLGVCTPDDDVCADAGYPNLVCSTDCKCVAPGGVGTNCNNGPGPLCTPDNDKCGKYLVCNSSSCLCEGTPVITGVSPVGGFCEDDVNQPCLEDLDCLTGFCDLETPNGAENNLITILGDNFGNAPGQVRIGALEARAASEINPSCVKYWSNKQIIVAVPAGGAGTSIITVKTADNKETSTNDGVGDNIPDFQFNNINRPGLCLINPDSANFKETVNYFGVNMFNTADSNIYFGLYDENQRVKAPEVNFNGLTASALVPNIGTGLTSTFVKSTIAAFPLYSNYLNFTKKAEPDPLPYISSFEPLQGAPGQYITIYGYGFGNQRGAKVVKIGDEEVTYDFPAVCAASVWSNEQIIVKVPPTMPNGNYPISIKYPNGDEIDTSNLNPDKFTANNLLPLLPSLCKLSPSKGQVGFEVDLWGEYFGSPNSKAVFYNNKESEVVAVAPDGLADKITVEVPEQAITGPVAVKNGLLTGNSLNFAIGPCQTNDECGGTNVCCPVGTYKANRCEASLGDCSLEVLNSVYEWSFSTGLGEITVPVAPEDSCLGWAKKIGACPINEFCPNSPGVCSVFPDSEKELGECGNDACNDVAGCEANHCVYNLDLNTCVHKVNSCSLDNTFLYDLGGQEFSAKRSCQLYQPDGQYHWQMSVKTSCPTDWIMTANNICVSINETCSVCEDSLTCQNINNDGDIIGECASQKICPPNSSCDTSDNKCKKSIAASCECCCEYEKDDRDCCVPLECKGSCGIGSVIINGVTVKYGNCYGCTVYEADGITVNQSASNAACNCTGHVNKYCDTSVAEGVCGDCSVISSENVCRETSSCCWDDVTDQCRGGNRIENEDDPSLDGYCAYYECNAGGGSCNTDNPVASSTDPFYSSIPQCNLACSDLPAYCASFTDSAQCIIQFDCCWDGKASPNKCRPTIGGNQGKIHPAELNGGYCAYYNCKEPPDEDQCNIAEKTIDGNYNSTSTCSYNCSGAGNINVGDPCYSLASSSCDINVCSGPFVCINEDGSGPGIPPPSSLCGRCCCDVSEPIDSCAFPNTEDLTCVANHTPCDGAGRGLCCGCSDDGSCGSPEITGCGVDTCCRPRPEIVSFTPPEDGIDKICRNAVIKVEFDQFMDISSLHSNIRVLEERNSDEPCSSGTYFTENREAENNNFLVKLWTSIKNLFTRSAVATTPPDSTNNYCLVPGSIQISQGFDGTTANFYPDELFKASTTYYILVIGDEALDSQTGVLSAWKIGMNGESSPVFNTVEYENSKISSFTTLGEDASNLGVCALDYVRLMPDTFLFNRDDNDPNENDTNVSFSTFDTIRDKDKLFTASAYSIDHQEIQGITGYNWDWELDILGNNVLDEITTTAGIEANQIFVEVAPNVRDDVEQIKAEINMDAYNPDENCNINCNTFLGGDGTYNISNVQVFICRNPWPSIKPDGSWQAFEYDYNSKFYYCRDFGSSAYVDDLPAVTNEPVAPLKGLCSISGTDCTKNSDCPLGQTCVIKGRCSLSGDECSSNMDCLEDELCINKVFREAYFFRQQGPSAGEILEVKNFAGAPLGGEVKLKWEGPKNYIYDNASSSFIGNNRIYYGIKNSGSMDYIDLSLTDQDSYCTTTLADYQCDNFILKGLDNNETYVFRMSAISQSKIETMFSNEIELIPLDVKKPNQPFPCQINNYNPGDEEINISCYDLTSVINDISYLRFYHGLISGQYGQSFDSQIHSYSITLPTNLFNNNTTHYFAVSAIDAAGNESVKSAEMTILIEDAP